MHEGTIANGPIGNWLAIIGVVSLIYWGWRICAAILGRSPGKESAAAVPAPAAAGGDAPLAAVAAPEERHRRHRGCGLRAAGSASHRASRGRKPGRGLGSRRPLDATDFAHDPPLIAQHRTQKCDHALSWMIRFSPLAQRLFGTSPVTTAAVRSKAPTRKRNMRKFRITVDGRSYNVVVEDLREGAETAHPHAASPAPPRLSRLQRRRLPQPQRRLRRSSLRWAAWWTRST